MNGWCSLPRRVEEPSRVRVRVRIVILLLLSWSRLIVCVNVNDVTVGIWMMFTFKLQVANKLVDDRRSIISLFIE